MSALMFQNHLSKYFKLHFMRAEYVIYYETSIQDEENDLSEVDQRLVQILVHAQLTGARMRVRTALVPLEKSNAAALRTNYPNLTMSPLLYLTESKEDLL